MQVPIISRVQKTHFSCFLAVPRDWLQAPLFHVFQSHLPPSSLSASFHRRSFKIVFELMDFELPVNKVWSYTIIFLLFLLSNLAIKLFPKSFILFIFNNSEHLPSPTYCQCILYCIILNVILPLSHRFQIP